MEDMTYAQQARNRYCMLLRTLDALLDPEREVDAAQMYDLPCELPMFGIPDWDALADVRRRAIQSREQAFRQDPESLFQVTQAVLIGIWVTIHWGDSRVLSERREEFEALPYSRFFTEHGMRFAKNELPDFATLLQDPFFRSDNPVEQWLAHLYLVFLLLIHNGRWYRDVVAMSKRDSRPMELMAKNGLQAVMLAEIGERIVAWIPLEHLAAFRTHWLMAVKQTQSPYEKTMRNYYYYPVEEVIRTLAQNGCKEAQEECAELDYQCGLYWMPERGYGLADMMDEYGEADDSYGRDLARAYDYFESAAKAGHEQAKKALEENF